MIVPTIRIASSADNVTVNLVVNLTGFIVLIVLTDEVRVWRWWGITDHNGLETLHRPLTLFLL